jgi:PAS domain S-box-containing protein
MGYMTAGHGAEAEPTAAEVVDLVGRVGAAVAGATTVEDALAGTLELVSSLSGWEVGHVCLARAARVVGTAIWHGADDSRLARFREHSERFELAAGEGFVGRVVASGEVTWISDLVDDATFVRRESALACGLRAMLAVPLVANGEVLGLLELFRSEPGEPAPELVSLLQALGAALARLLERERVIEQLRASEQRYRLVFEGASDAILLGGVDGRLQAVNPAACRLLGYSEEELVGMDARELTPPEWHDAVDNQVRRKLNGCEDATAYEMFVVDGSGARIPVEVRSSLVHDGETTSILGVVRDDRDRKRVELALRESEDRFRSAFEAAHIGMALVAVDGRWLKVNAALCRIVGYGEEELLTMRFQDLTHPDDLAPDLALLERLLQDEFPSYQLEKRYIHRDGHEVPIHLSVSLVRADDGTPLYAISQIVETSPEPADSAERRTPLSGQETRVLSAAAAGLTASEIARLLGIGEETVHTYLRRAATKLGARSRLHAVATAARHGLIDWSATGA